MADICRLATLCCLLYLLSLLVGPLMAALVQQQPLVLKYHNGDLLKGNVTVNLVWYGRFTPAQRSIIVDFIHSLSSPVKSPLPSAASWWKTTEKYRGGSSNLVVAGQVLHEAYTLGKSLKRYHLLALAGKFNAVDAITVVLTAADVAVEGFCMNCGSHGATRGKSAYVWVGNSETQCPGQCAWPFHQPLYGPQTPPLVAPNGDVGVDGMIINIATLLADTLFSLVANGLIGGLRVLFSNVSITVEAKLTVQMLFSI